MLEVHPPHEKVHSWARKTLVIAPGLSDLDLGYVGHGLRPIYLAYPA